MRRFIAIAVVLSLILVSAPVFAAKDRRGASDKAYEQASDEAIFHRVGDWFATRGKSAEEKEAIIAERKAKRAAKRAQKELEKKKKAAEKELEKKKKAAEKEGRKLKKGTEKGFKGSKKGSGK